MRAPLVLTALILLALPPLAAARPGELDLGYGERGARSLAVGVTSAATELAAAPDGSAFVAGRAIQEGAERVLIAKLTPAGGLDSAFRVGLGATALQGTGMALFRFGANPAPPQRAGAIALQPDGKVIVAGVAESNWFVVRFTTAGRLDRSFAVNGIFLIGMGGSDEDRTLPDSGPVGLAVRPDGRILLIGNRPVQGNAEASSITLLGLLADGTLDPTVGGNGIVISQLGLSSGDLPASSSARAVALTPDGRALVAGSATDRSPAGQAVVARYFANGRLDNTFGERGKRVVPHPYAALDGSFEGIALATDGSIVVSGTAPSVPGRVAAIVARLTEGGQLDQRFGRGGVARMQLGFGAAPQTQGLGVALDGADRPVLSGQALSVDRRRSSVVVARLRTDGAIDCRFADRGRAYPFSGGLDRDAAGSAAVARVPGNAFLLAGARPEGLRAGAFVERFVGGGGSRPAVAPPGAATGRQFLSLGGGRVGVGGLVDPRCSNTMWALEYGERSFAGRTPWRTIPAGAGPQDLCVRLAGLRPGRRYRIRLVARSRGGRTSGGVRSFTLSRERQALRCVT